MAFRSHPKTGLAKAGAIVVVVLSACGVGTGCARSAIESAVRRSTSAYQAQLRAVPAADETPEQAARIAALRDRVLRDEWVEWGYRVGNEKGGGTILYSMAGKEFFSALFYPLKLVSEGWSYAFGGDRPNRAARLMEDPASADNRRRGINDLVRWDFALNGPYVKRYRQIATGDPDPLVRATAIRALNRARDAQARPIFIDALRDASADVRIEAAKALANLPDPNAAAPLARVVSNGEEDRDVRIAAASALRHYKSLEVARALIPRLGEHDFGLAWESRHSLRWITGKDLRYDEAAWLAYVAGPDKPFG
jgi:hypothetical protein